MKQDAAETLVRALDLRLEEVAACALCLLNIAWALRDGDERKVQGAVRFHAPILWDEGLDGQIRAALDVASRAGLPGAEDAVADVRARGDRATVVLAIVRDLARQQLEEMERAEVASRN